MQRQLKNLQELEKYFQTLSKEELIKYEELSKIPVLSLWKYNENNIWPYNYPSVWWISWEVWLPQLKVDIIVVPKDYVYFMQNEVSKRDPNILVISFDDIEKFQTKYKQAYLK